MCKRGPVKAVVNETYGIFEDGQNGDVVTSIVGRWHALAIVKDVG